MFLLVLSAVVAVFEINDNEAAIFGVDTPDFVHIKGILIKFDALIQIKNVQIIVNHAEFHKTLLLCCAERFSNLNLSAIPLPDPVYEKQRTRIIYNPIAEHDYSVNAPSFREITPGHIVYCNDEEEEKYRQQLK